MLLANSVERSRSWKLSSFSSLQEIPRIWCNLKVHYRIHKNPPPVHILSQVNQARALSTNLLNIIFNIIVLSMSGSSKWSLFFPLPCHHLIILYVTTQDNICWGTEINSCSRATKILGYLVWNPLFVLLKWYFFGLCPSSELRCDIANQKMG